MTYQTKFTENLSEDSFTQGYSTQGFSTLGSSTQGSDTENRRDVGQNPTLRRRTTANLSRTAAKAVVRGGRAAVGWMKRRTTRRSVSNEELSTSQELTREPESYCGLADAIGPQQGLALDPSLNLRRRREATRMTPRLEGIRQVSARRADTHPEGIRHISAATYPPAKLYCQRVARKPVPRRKEARQNSRGLERFQEVEERHMTGDPAADQETLELAILAADYYSPPQPVFPAEYHLPPQPAFLSQAFEKSPEAVDTSPHVSPPAFTSAASSRSDLIAFTPVSPADLITFSRDNLLLETNEGEQNDLPENDAEDHEPTIPRTNAPKAHTCVLPCLCDRIPVGNLSTRLDTLIPACGLLVDARWDRAMARLRRPTTANMIPTTFLDTPEDEDSESSGDCSANEPVAAEIQPGEYQPAETQKADWELPSAFISPAPLPQHLRRGEGESRHQERGVQRSEEEELLWALTSPAPLRWGPGGRG